MIRRFFIGLGTVMLLASCATAPRYTTSQPLPRDFTAVRVDGNLFDTSYRSGLGWSKEAARYGYIYWNARLTLESGSRYFVVENEEIRTQRVPTGGGSTTRGGSQTIASGTFADSDPVHVLKGTIKMFNDRPEAVTAIDAREFLREARLPSKHTRLTTDKSGR